MKRISALLFLICLSTAAMAASDTLRVLFVGNSYVQVNNLPSIITQMAANRGDVLLTSDASVGGSTLQQHSMNGNTLALIAQKGWDFVVLQEQSQMPSFPDAQVAQDTYPYARMLDSLVHVANPCAKTVFYMTWGRKNGDAGNCPYFPLVCTYNGMDSLLRARYTIMAQTNKAVLSPVGVAWHKMRDLYPGTDLYQSDESHPSAVGSYLAAATFYTIFFKKDPSLINYDFSLSSIDARNVRQVVTAEVWDSLGKWYRYRSIPPYPVAGFTSSVTGKTVQFTNLSQYAVKYFWDFGDGTTDTATTPTHTYAANAVYQVRLATLNCDGATDTAINAVNVGATGIEQTAAGTLRVYPNPATDRLQIVNAAVPSALALYDAQGRRCLYVAQPQSRELTLELKSLSAGLYFLHIWQADGSRAVRMIDVRP